MVTGPNLTSNLKKIQQAYPNLDFGAKLKRVFDVKEMLREVVNFGILEDSTFLCTTKLSFLIFWFFDGTQFCCSEEFGNWEHRPLRKSQLHYAASKVGALAQLIKKLTKPGKLKLNDYIKDNSQLLRLFDGLQM